MRATRPALRRIIASCAAILLTMLVAGVWTPTSATTRGGGAPSVSSSAAERSTTNARVTPHHATVTDDEPAGIPDLHPAVLTPVAIAVLGLLLVRTGERIRPARGRPVPACRGRAPPVRG